MTPENNAGKMLAEWFWIERWEGSAAALLPMEAQGIYRAMLSHAWRRGACLPADLEEVQLLIRCRTKEWRRSWPLVAPYWKERDGVLVNETQLEVYADALEKRDRARARAQAGAQARHKQPRKQVLEDCPPSPSPLLPNHPPSSSLRTERRDDVEEARGTLRAALREVEGRHHGLTHQQILDLPQFRAPSGPVRLETCAHGPLMLATAAKIRAPIMRGAKVRTGAPSWDRPDTQSADLQARAVAWASEHWPRWTAINRREDLEATLAGLSPPPDLAGEIKTHLIFGLYPHLTQQTPQEGQPA